MSMPEPSNKRKSLDTLRVYAPSRGSLAVETEALPVTRVAEPLPARQRRPKLVALPQKKRRTFADVLREHKVLQRAAMLVSIFAVAFALVVSGYNRISAAQRDLNSLSKQAEKLKNSVEQTNIDLLFSISSASPQDAAEAAGMSYPVNGHTGS